MRATRLLTALAVGLSVAAAWPEWLPEPDSLMVRQDNGDSSNTAKETATTPAPSKETGDSQTTNRNLNTATAPDTKAVTTGTNKSGKSGTKTGTKSTGKQTYSFDVPAGSVAMVTPATTTGTPIYKISDYVTFGWTYTNLKAKPTAVDVILSCAAATETWTLTANMTFQTSAAYVWDSREQATAVESPLLTEMYTLIIIDSDSSVTATQEPGYLAGYSGLTFGMYKAAKYTPLSEWHCGTCNSALGSFDGRAFTLAIGMSAVTVLSFTWFVAGFGVGMF